MNEFIEDDNEDEAVSGLPPWIWAGSVIIITLALISYLVFY